MAPGFPSIAAEYVEVRVTKTLAKAPFLTARSSIADAPIPYLLGSGLLLALTALFVWQAPVRNGPAAIALAVAVALDAASRLAADAATRRSGLVVAMEGLPSLVLLLGAAPGLAALALAVLPVVGPERFPIAASLIAGMIAMGALARLSLTRSVLVLAKAAARDPLAPV